jgi:hypothetical protein
MKAIDENCPAKAALRELSSEIDDLHMDKRQRDDLIKNLQQQIRIMRETMEAERKLLLGNSEYLETAYANVLERWKQAEIVTDQAIFAMFAVCALSFVAIGCAVLMGWLW